MTGQPPTRPQGFLNELRSQHWLVKLVLIGVAGALGSPFIGLFLFAVHAILGGFGIFLGGVALLLLAAWFLGSQPPGGVSLPQSRDTAVDLRRFCPACGESMSEILAVCPACARPMPPPADPAIATLAATLNDLAVLFSSGQIDAASYSQLRHVYETRLDALRPLPAGEPELAAPPVAAPESAEPEPERAHMLGVGARDAATRREVAEEHPPLRVFATRVRVGRFDPSRELDEPALLAVDPCEPPDRLCGPGGAPRPERYS